MCFYISEIAQLKQTALPLLNLKSLVYSHVGGIHQTLAVYTNPSNKHKLHLFIVQDLYYFSMQYNFLPGTETLHYKFSSIYRGSIPCNNLTIPAICFIYFYLFYFSIYQAHILVKYSYQYINISTRNSEVIYLHLFTNCSQTFLFTNQNKYKSVLR